MASRVAVAPPPRAAAEPAAPAASTKWGWRERSAQFFCLIILLGFPIFSVPCQKGTCYGPVDVVATYGYCKGLLSDDWTSYLLYPASLMQKMETLVGDDPQNFKLPEWNGILSSWNLTSNLKQNEKKGAPTHFRFPSITSMYESKDSQSLSYEFVVVCLFCMVAAVTVLAGPNRLATIGIMGIIWYMFVEGGSREDVSAQPMLALALVCSLGWVKFNELFSSLQSAAPDTSDKRD